jgi:hypothetical protein
MLLVAEQAAAVVVTAAEAAAVADTAEQPRALSPSPIWLTRHSGSYEDCITGQELGRRC